MSLLVLLVSMALGASVFWSVGLLVSGVACCVGASLAACRLLPSLSAIQHKTSGVGMVAGWRGLGVQGRVVLGCVCGFGPSA